ncbi:spore cortex biosynthesis protein YabQ [Thermolongibacillus altinsuensis]|uniref:Spore cortex biosynthesis protein YabQ n=1 Tax=Thermolongibacillus altinsuensis TaxID=575256 RepID=A0A4R1QD11_9BACL|nr:spore cortex biosynthesis protein YabQ [Thermolongibacillus altinsuensis]TCL46099.1 spore cortex biosynthesis protein YabQ [Thermolongibacillus altinsuensis]
MSLTTQFFTMLSMIGIGSWLGATFDTYARLWNRSKKARWIVFISDVLFWIVQALLTFYVLLLVNNGEIRFYIFLALLCGYAAYQSLFKTTYLKILEFFIRIVVSIYRLIIRLFHYFVILPLRLIYRFIVILLFGTCHILLYVGKILYKIVRFLVKLLLKPFHSIFIFFWTKIPIRLRTKVIVLLKKGKGFWQKIANLFRKKR